MNRANMLIESAKLIFIHIPKTGGTTFENYLFHKFKIPFSDLYEKVHNGHSLQHCTYREMKQFIANNTQNNYKIIAFIRNPFHRIISDLFHFQQIKRDSSQEEIHRSVVHVLTTKQTIEDRYLNWDNHFLPQTDYLLDENGKIPPHMIIIETSDIDKVMSGLYPDFKLMARHNVTPNKPNYDNFFLEKTKQFIRKFYQKDFDLFFDLETGCLKTRSYYPMSLLEKQQQNKLIIPRSTLTYHRGVVPIKRKIPAVLIKKNNNDEL